MTLNTSDNPCSTPRATTPHHQKGVALIAVIWVMALLSLIAASFTLQTRTQINLARNAVDNAEARAHADAGINLAILELLNANAETSLPLNGTPVERTYKGSRLTLRVQDESGLIDINKARPQLLSALFISAGLNRDEAETLADAVADYRDTDSLKRLKGAEDEDYHRAGRALGAADKPFATVDELRRVLGMTEAIYDAVKDAATVHSRRRAPDKTTAPPLVLATLRGEEGNNIDPSTEEEAIKIIDNTPPLSASPSATIGDSAAGIRIGRRNTAYMVEAKAMTQSGAVFIREAIVRLSRRGKTPYTVLVWRQGSEAASPAAP